MQYLPSRLYLLLLFLLAGSAVRSQTLPIKSVRTLSFTTDKGSYMNVDLSPDGKTLVYDLLGDLYTLPAAGGKATQLTRGLALNEKPVFSPDGKRIAFYSDRSGHWGISIFNLTDAETHELNTGDDDPGSNYSPLLWTPGGHAVRTFSTIYNLDGRHWLAPKGRLVGYLADGSYYVQSHDTVYQMVNKDGSRQFICRLPAGSQELVASVDGHWLGYLDDSAGKLSLNCMNLISHQSRQLVASLIQNSQDHFNLNNCHYAFSPDAKAIYIAFRGKIHRVELETGADQVIPFSADLKVDMGALDDNRFNVSIAPLNVKYIRSAATSPDGKTLVFTALNRIYIKTPNGKPKILVKQSFNQYQPCWSPDGHWIAYVSWCDTAGGYLWKVPARGGKPIRLTTVAGQYQRPCWSPDGTSIAVIKGGTPQSRDQLSQYAAGGGMPQLGERDDIGIGQLQLINANEKWIKHLVDSIPLWNQLGFSADGRVLSYEPFAGPEEKGSLVPQLMGLDLLTGKKTLIAVARTGIDLYRLQQRLLSPDGKYLVYTLDENLYLVMTHDAHGPIDLYDPAAGVTAVRFAQGVDPHWEQGGKVLAWNYANDFYRIDPDRVFGTRSPTQLQPDQQVKVRISSPSLYAKGTIVLKNARIITMEGNKVIEKGTILIRNGRFSAIGEHVPLPPDAKIIDLSGKTIIPGFVDMHLHMYVPPDIFPQQCWMYLANLAYGVTTARDPSSSYDSFGYGELLQTGQMIGPRLYTSGRPVRFTDGVVRFDGAEDAAEVVRQRKTLGGTFMKEYSLPTRIQRQWLLMASRKAGLNMTNEGGNMGWMWLLGMLKDGSSGIEHNAGDWNDVHDDIIRLMAKSGTYFTPTLQVAPDDRAREYFNMKYWQQPDAKLRRFMPMDQLAYIGNANPADTAVSNFLYAAQIDARIRHAGGRVTLGSHGNDEGIGVHNELWALQMGGLTNLEALQSATILPAQALGMQKDIGSIRAGKIADLVILNANPLDDIHNSRDIHYVIRAGVLYDAHTLDEIWPVKKKCPEWRLKSKTISNEAQN